MKLTIKASDFHHIVSQALLGSSRHITAGSASTVTFEETGLQIGFIEQNVVSIYATYKPSFFSSYEVKETETLSLSKTLQKALGAFGDSIVTITTTKDKIFIEGDKSKYNEPLARPDETKVQSKFPMPMESQANYGYMPKSTSKTLAVKILVEAKNLKAPEGDITFEVLNEKLTETSQGFGEYSTEVPIDKQVGVEAKLKISSAFFLPVLSALRGKIWLCFSSLAFVICETDENHSSTFFIATRK